jgi:glycerol-3-phosphate cytidylyltransferase-like family protein
MEKWLELSRRYGVNISSKGLVLPRQNRLLLDKRIANNLQMVYKMISSAREKGKDIIILPGSFDLLHIGHVSFLDQVINQYLKKAAKVGRNLTRDDLFIVMLADDDKLIGLVKAYKYIGNGGKEMFRRPIERAKRGEPGHIRLDTLASLPVDCVGFIPSPLNNDLAAPELIDVKYCHQLATGMLHDDVGKYASILDAYQHLDKIIERPTDLINPPSTAAWQLYIMLKLTKPTKQEIQIMPQAYMGKNITRIVSVYDAGYLDMVRVICRWATIAVDVIKDEQLLSTTELLKAYSPAELKEHKRNETFAQLQS